MKRTVGMVAVMLAALLVMAAPRSAEAGKGKACKQQKREQKCSGACTKKEKTPSFEKQFKDMICSPIDCGKKRKKKC